MKRFLLAYNPVSGNALFKSRLDSMVEAFQRRGLMLFFYRTQRDGNEDLPSVARDLGAEGIIAAGGDGTLHEVVNLVMKARLGIPVGIIGSGTSNDFATYLQCPKGLASFRNEDMEAYFDRIAEGRTRRVDLGRVGEEYFVNVASAGMMTDIAHKVDARLKNSLGKMAYYIRGIGELPKFRAISIQLEADGARQEFEAFLFVVINSAVVGSMRNVSAAARIDDGKLDFLAVQKCSPAQLVKLTADLIAGKPVTEQDAVLHVQASRFRIASAHALPSDLDGEVGPMLPLEIETVPGAIDIYC